MWTAWELTLAEDGLGSTRDEWRSTNRHPSQNEAGPATRLRVYTEVAVLLQIKLLPGKRTQNSPDFAAAYCCLIRSRHGAVHFLGYGISLGGGTI